MTNHIQINTNEKDFLTFYMSQTWEEMRHIENLRERVTILVITIASAISGFIIQQKYAVETKPLSWFVVVLGVFGFLMTLKLYQIHQLAQKRLDKWYRYYESFCGENSQIITLRDLADKETRKKYPLISKIKHSYFWATIHVFIIIAGFYIIMMFPAKQDSGRKLPNSTQSIKIHGDTFP